MPEEHALEFGEYTYPHNLHYYIGQLNPVTKKPQGLGRRISSKSGRILEGQFENGIPSGYEGIFGTMAITSLECNKIHLLTVKANWSVPMASFKRVNGKIGQ